MCSIICGFKAEELISLIEINQRRGNFSHSLYQSPDILYKDFGTFNYDLLNDLTEKFTVVHVQAPTSGLLNDKTRIHPTEQNNSLLWHNGIIKPSGISYIQAKIKTKEVFDTKLLHKVINEFGFDILSEIEGLFSCLYYDGDNYYIFRTKHGKLYVDDKLNISSERFSNSKCINYDTVYKLNLAFLTLKEVSTFKTKRFNYIIKGEMND